MNDFIPTTEEVRKLIEISYNSSHIEEFDRWLAQVKAEAWKEGYVAGFLKAMGGELDGSNRAAVRLLTGFTDAELDELGGFEEEENK